MDVDSQLNAKPQLRTGSLLVMFLTTMIDLLGFGLVLPLLPIFAKQYSSDESGITIGMLMASFSLMQFIFAPLWGSLSDRIGRRPVIMIGLASSAIFYFLFGLATIWKSLGLIFVARIGAGVAGATIPITQAYIADCTTPEKRAGGMALIGMAFGIGFTFGPLLGMLAVPSGEGDPGPWPGYVAAILSTSAFLLAVFVLPESLHAGSKSASRKWIDTNALRESLRTPVILAVLITIFICVFSFSKFETTLSLLLKGEFRSKTTPFHFTFRQVFETYAIIGGTLMFIQGGIVRPLSQRVKEPIMATIGSLLEIVGFALIAIAIHHASVTLMFVALVVIVTGFSFLQPTLNSMLSRAASDTEQGAVMGLGQSINSLARIIGSGVAIPLLALGFKLPYLISALLMVAGTILIFSITNRLQHVPLKSAFQK